MFEDFDMVVGVEVHVELCTKSKIFCGCTTEFGGEQNTHTCPVCLGLPGVLPVLNRQVVEYAIKTGLALNCEIADFSKFDRKNYFYPDAPKNFQTSQYDLPICKSGWVDIEVDGVKKRIGITRAHMEDDAGKLVHSGDTISTSSTSYVDYNRTGVPLLEIVSEPDMKSIDDTVAFLEKLVQIIEYIGVSDCKLEQGSIRFDINASLMPKGSEKLGTRTESKNLNSFSSVRRCLEYELLRQAQILRNGGEIVQETRTWDEGKGITLSLRSKEEAHDYRYFPEPDLVPMVIDRDWVERVRQTLPELPDTRREKLISLGLPEYDAKILTTTRGTADFFDTALLTFSDAKTLSNWVMGDFMRLLNSNGVPVEKSPINPEALAELLTLVDKGTISGKIAKGVIEEMFATGKGAAEIVKEKGLVQISDEGALVTIIEQVVAANPQSVLDFQAGKERAIGFLVGQVMKETKGQANPGVVNKLLKEKLLSL
jgi:aspartyl-tRNA(Asn)/glutamyl-tRNA(Gln) amidotransferase subunit B